MAEGIAEAPAAAAAPIKASTVAEVPREVLANAAARAGLGAVVAQEAAAVDAEDSRR